MATKEMLVQIYLSQCRHVTGVRLFYTLNMSQYNVKPDIRKFLQYLYLRDVSGFSNYIFLYLNKIQILKPVTCYYRFQLNAA